MSDPVSLQVLLSGLRSAGLGAVGGAVGGGGLAAFRARGTPERNQKALRGARRGAVAGATLGAVGGVAGEAASQVGKGLGGHAQYLREVAKDIRLDKGFTTLELLERANRLSDAGKRLQALEPGLGSIASGVGTGAWAARRSQTKKANLASLSGAIKGTAAALRKTGLTGGMTALKSKASTASQGLGALKTNVLKAGKTGTPWSPKMAGIRPGAVVGAVGGARGAGNEGLASLTAGAAVGGAVGDMVLPAVYRALLGDPSLAAVALPAALLASGVAGEVSGTVVSKFFKKKGT